MDTNRFTSSLALPSEHTDAVASVWIQQDEPRQALAASSPIAHSEATQTKQRLTIIACTIRRSHLPKEPSSSNSLQDARRQELTAYLQHLKHKQSAEPRADLTFGKDFYSLVQRLSQQRKTEYESVRGTDKL